MVAYFEEVAAAVGDGKAAANRMSDLVIPALTERKEEIEEFPITADEFAEFLKATAPVQPAGPPGRVQAHAGARVGRRTRRWRPSASSRDFDEAALREAVADAIAANPKAVADFKKGKTAAANRIKGQVMKANKGAPNDVVQRCWTRSWRKRDVVQRACRRHAR